MSSFRPVSCGTVRRDFWIDPVHYTFHDEKNKFAFNQSTQSLDGFVDVDSGASYEDPSQNKHHPDGVQGYILYNSRTEDVRVDLEHSAQRRFRGGINFFEVDESPFGRSVRPYLQVVIQGYPSGGFGFNRLEIVFDQDQLRLLPPVPIFVSNASIVSFGQNARSFGRSLILAQARRRYRRSSRRWFNRRNCRHRAVAADRASPAKATTKRTIWMSCKALCRPSLMLLAVGSKDSI